MTVGINRVKASSHPTPIGGVYLGVVKTVLPDGKVYVYIPKFSNTVGPMRVTNQISGDAIAQDDRVICSHIGGGSEEMYVIGHLKIQNSSDGGTGADTSVRDIKLSIYMEVD